ncbi:hypothetical protein [Paraferrimonas sp. SM1919]|uniref:hypothetical protein n=1 Tax=Paraferrimonas sp. SM1919 TaxID=2662263 RepID=UPI0013D1D2CE|nr:hypothetical protein [Paraferrimonas sp. SM1919]
MGYALAGNLSFNFAGEIWLTVAKFTWFWLYQGLWFTLPVLVSIYYLIKSRTMKRSANNH